MGGAAVFADTWPRRYVVTVCGKGYKLSPLRSQVVTADGAWRYRLTALGAIHGSRLWPTALGALRLENGRRWPPWIFPADAS